MFDNPNTGKGEKMAWSKKLKKRFKTMCEKAQNRDDLKTKVLADPNLKKKGWPACEQKAIREDWLKKVKISSYFYFNNLSDYQRKKLLELLTNDSVSWEEAMVFVKNELPDPTPTKAKLRNFARDHNIKINKAAVEKRKEKTPNQLNKRDEEKVYSIIKARGKVSIDFLEESVGISKQAVYKVIDNLVKRGYGIQRLPSGEFESVSDQLVPVTSEHVWRNRTRILVWSGSELGSIGQQGKLLATVYQTIVPEEKPDFIIGLGGIVQGYLSKARENETFLGELDYFKEGLEKTINEDNENGEKARKYSKTELLWWAQTTYAAKIFPNCHSSHQARTYLISGLKELSFIKHGLTDPLEKIAELTRENGRPDKEALVYFGRNMHMFYVTNAGSPVGVLALTSKKSPFRGVYTRGYRPRKTSASLASWMINKLKRVGVQEYPRVILWSDGVGMYTSRGDAEATCFTSLPKLSVTDPTDLELDTSPNLGVTLVDLAFDDKGNLTDNGITISFRNLAPYIEEKGW